MEEVRVGGYLCRCVTTLDRVVSVDLVDRDNGRHLSLQCERKMPFCAQCDPKSPFNRMVSLGSRQKMPHENVSCARIGAQAGNKVVEVGMGAVVGHARFVHPKGADEKTV